MWRARVVLTVGLFTIWTFAVMTPLLADTDHTLSMPLRQYDSPMLQSSFTLVRDLGDFPLTAVLVLLIGGALLRSGRGKMALLLWTLFVAGSMVEWMGHQWFPAGVPSPSDRLPVDVANSWGLWARGRDLASRAIHGPYGYPSGHAFRAFLLVAGAYVTWWARRNESRPHPPTILLAGAGTAVVTLMGIALVYLGDHRASEVIGGYLLGMVCATVLERAPEEPPSEPQSRASSDNRVSPGTR